jgi:transcription elongation GreA/GreB family factor
MIDKQKLQTVMLALTEAELAQAHVKYEQFLAEARLDRSEVIERDEQAQAETAADLAEAFDDREHQAELKVAALKMLDFGPKDVVEPGAVVRFGDRFLVVSVSTAEFECGGRRCIGISPAAPIYKALEGKAQGEDCVFRGRTLHIHELY